MINRLMRENNWQQPLLDYWINSPESEFIRLIESMEKNAPFKNKFRTTNNPALGVCVCVCVYYVRWNMITI